MSELRCKPGCRAIVTKALHPENLGRVVEIERLYVPGEIVGGWSWDVPPPCWIITSLGDPISSSSVSGVSYADSVCVGRDAWLTPLGDLDDEPESIPAESPITETA